MAKQDCAALVEALNKIIPLAHSGSLKSRQEIISIIGIALDEVMAVPGYGDAGRTEWLNGWPQMYRVRVLIGTGVHCIGCGAFRGTTTVAFPEGYTSPPEPPDWPFDEGNCPVCVTAEDLEAQYKKEFGHWPPRAVDLYKELQRLKASVP